MPHAPARSRESVKRGVWQAGGFPLEVPAMSLSEPFMKPSTMLYRNLLAMETEELLRSYPFDGAVLLGGCDKTTPALVMGAISRRAAVHLRPGRSDAAGVLARPDARLGLGRLEVLGRAARRQRSPRPTGSPPRSGSRRSPGHCMTMGTASTMTSAVEALGLTLPGAASIPAADSDHPRMAVASGRRIVSLPESPAVLGVLRERDHGRAGAGRLHQRGHPPDRHGRAEPALKCRCAASTSSPAKSRCWPTCARAASTSCRTSSRPADSAP